MTSDTLCRQCHRPTDQHLCTTCTTTTIHHLHDLARTVRDTYDTAAGLQVPATVKLGAVTTSGHDDGVNLPALDAAHQARTAVTRWLDQVLDQRRATRRPLAHAGLLHDEDGANHVPVAWGDLLRTARAANTADTALLCAMAARLLHHHRDHPASPQLAHNITRAHRIVTSTIDTHSDAEDATQASAVHVRRLHAGGRIDAGMASYLTIKTARKAARRVAGRCPAERTVYAWITAGVIDHRRTMEGVMLVRPNDLLDAANRPRRRPSKASA